MKILFTRLTFLLCFGALFLEINAQQVSFKPFSVNESNLIAELKSLKNSNPNISADEFIKNANLLLEKQGLNFVVGLDPATCQKIEQLKKAQKTPGAPLNLRATLKSPLGESATLSLPEAEFSKNECFSCFMNLAFLEITDKDFVTVVEGSNLKFFLPGNFLVSEAALVDEKDLTTVKKKWRMPLGATPISVSDDGNILYLGFEDPELKDLTLAAFGEGVYQFHAKKDLDAKKKRSQIEKPQNITVAPNISFIKFESTGKKQTIKAPVKCLN